MAFHFLETIVLSQPPKAHCVLSFSSSFPFCLLDADFNVFIQGNISHVDTHLYPNNGSFHNKVHVGRENDERIYGVYQGGN